MKPKFLVDSSLSKLRNRRFQHKLRTERAEEFRIVKQNKERAGKTIGKGTFKQWLHCEFTL